MMCSACVCSSAVQKRNKATTLSSQFLFLRALASLSICCPPFPHAPPSLEGPRQEEKELDSYLNFRSSLQTCIHLVPLYLR